MSDHESLAGRLLVAEPGLGDSNFSRSVVVLLEHSEAGALGVVLDRPSEVMADEVLPLWAPYVAAPGVVFSGGPVSPEVAICLAQRRDDTDAEGWQRTFASIGTLDVSRAPSESVDDLTNVRIFAGYSGWEAGQLEGEIEVGGWYVVDRADDDLFTSDPSTLWRRVLRRQPGRLSTVGLFPDDLSVN